MTYSIVWFLSYGVMTLGWFVLVVWLCVALYWSLRLPALPWIACRYVFAFLSWLATGYLLRAIFPAGTLATSDHFSPDGWIMLLQATLEAGSQLLVAVLAFGEVAFLVAKAFPNVQSALLDLLLVTRRHVRPIGFGACILTISAPMSALIFLLIHGPFANKV